MTRKTGSKKLDMLLQAKKKLEKPLQAKKKQERIEKQQEKQHVTTPATTTAPAPSIIKTFAVISDAKKAVIGIPVPSSNNSHVNQIFIKKHAGTIKTKSNFTSVFNKQLIGKEQQDASMQLENTANKTLFCVNPHHNMAFKEAAQLFEQFGPVQSIHFGDLTSEHEKELAHVPVQPFAALELKPFYHAGAMHVVFDEQESLKRAMQANSVIHSTSNTSTSSNRISSRSTNHQQLIITSLLHCVQCVLCGTHSTGTHANQQVDATI